MEGKKNFLLLSLDDNKAKKVANILSNKSCSKILEFLTEREATETEISEKLKIPISTVHYNLQQLLDAKLIMWNKYHYSEKGKEVKHYTVANKYIIITPKGDSSGFLDKLKTLIPSFLFVGAGAYLVNWYNTRGFESFSENSMMKSFDTGAGMIAEDAILNETPMMMAKAMPTEDIIMNMDYSEPIIESYPFWKDWIYQYWFWFLIGAIFGILVYVGINWVRNKLR